LAVELKETLGLELTLIKGDRGAFEIKVGEDLIYSKLELRRFPEPGEVVRLLQERS
jgi:selT/selW/selH-like putative selenoprotein